MKKTPLALLVFSCLLGVSCATYQIVPFQNDNTRIESERGRSIPVYSNDAVVMIIDPEYRESDLMLRVSLKNLSSQSIHIEDKDFKVFTSSDRINWTPVDVYDSKSYYKKEKTAYVIGAVALALGAAADGLAAGTGYENETGSFQGQTSYGSYSGTYTSRTTYYDPAAAQIAAQKNAELMASYEQDNEQWLKALERFLFYSEDLNPNEEYFGLVFSKARKSKYYKVTCTNPHVGEIVIEYERKQF